MTVDVNAQAELTVPAGLPDWAFNVPDKVQPTAVKVEGTILEGKKEIHYDKAAYRTKDADIDGAIVDSVARELMSSLTHRLLTHDVRYEIGKEALEAIDRARFH